jgi:hypothetical protein
VAAPVNGNALAPSRYAMSRQCQIPPGTTYLNLRCLGEGSRGASGSGFQKVDL